VSQIVVGFDGSEHALRALGWAAEEAKARGVALSIVRSRHEPIFDGPIGPGAIGRAADHERLISREVEIALTQAMDRHPSVEFEYSVVEDRPVRALIDRGKRADLLVVGSRGRGGFLGLEIGSTSARLARQAPCPIIITRRDEPRGAKVVVGVDGSDCSRHALEWAAAEARTRHLALVVVMAWNYLEPQGLHGPEDFKPLYSPKEAGDTLVTIALDVLGTSPDVPVTLDSPCDLPARALLGYGGDAAMLVVGRHGSSGWAPPALGTTSQQVLHHAPCPIAVIPFDES
jgi:nucleotide-binding universal stress UspA family protein